MNQQEIDDCKKEMLDWQDKILDATRSLNTGQMAAAMHGENNCRFRLLQDRIEKLEAKLIQVEPPEGL